MLSTKGRLFSVAMAIAAMTPLARAQSLSGLIQKVTQQAQQPRASIQQPPPDQQRERDSATRQRNTPPPSADMQARIQLWAQEQSYFSSMPWPSTEVAFKSLRIGDNFNLDGPNVFSYGLESQKMYAGGEAITCSLSQDWGWFTCNIGLRRDNRDPADLASLGTAFGQNVTVSFTVVPTAPITWNALVTQKFGVGRIFSIRISTTELGSQTEFTDRAKQYFTDKFGAASKVSIQGGEGGQITSAQCASDLQRINKKPLSQLSQDDIDTKKSCEAEAMVGYAVQSNRANKVTTTKWTNSADHYEVLVESKGGVAINGTNDPTSFGVKLTIRRSFDEAADRLADIKKAWTQQRANSADSHARGDF